MKSCKEQIYDIVKVRASAGVHEVTTQYIADALGLRRSNASRLLNRLADEGRLQKRNGRPVLYGIAEELPVPYGCFQNLAGNEGSLKRAVRLIQAAVLYPQNTLGIHITGAHGTGRTLLASVAQSFARESGVLPEGAECRMVDCFSFKDDEERAQVELFGDGSSALIADNAEALAPRLRGRLFEDAETQCRPLLIVITDALSPASAELQGRFPITIELPRLDERPLEERFELVKRFMVLEAARAQKTISVSSELMRCLLLYECTFNVAQLKGDIKTACASAYVRSFSSNSAHMELFASDFEHYVRKGFLNYKKWRDDVERLVGEACSYSFGEDDVLMSPVDRDKLLYSYNVYDDMNRQADDLKLRGMSEKDVAAILSSELEIAFNSYRIQLSKQAVNRDQLSMLVDYRIPPLVQAFLDEASAKLSRSYAPSVFYGLCLHADAVIKRKGGGNKLSADQIKETYRNYHAEYALALQFTAKLEDEFGIRLSVDETVMLTLFISTHSAEAKQAVPAIVFALRGQGLSQAIADSACAASRQDNIFGINVCEEQDEEELYTELAEGISRADSGAGCVVCYDPPSLKQVLETIAAEENNEIRLLEFPLVETVSRWNKSAADGGIDELYGNILDSLSIGGLPRRHTIVTLCTTGEGGAQQMKRYIERYGNVGDKQVVALAITDKEELRNRLLELMKTSTVDCVVGAWNPKLFSIPFIPLSDALSCSPEKLPSVLSMKQQRQSEIDWEEVYAYLGNQLEHVDMKKLRRTLPEVLDGINGQIAELPLDSEIGLFIHLACCVNRLVGNERTPENPKRDEIISEHGAQYKTLVKLLKPLEKAFGIIVTDDETANMLTIIFKL